MTLSVEQTVHSVGFLWGAAAPNLHFFQSTWLLQDVEGVYSESTAIETIERALKKVQCKSEVTEVWLATNWSSRSQFLNGIVFLPCLSKSPCNLACNSNSIASPSKLKWTGMPTSIKTWNELNEQDCFKMFQAMSCRSCHGHIWP